jgi:hypothetical protein
MAITEQALAKYGAALLWDGPHPLRVLRSLPRMALYTDRMVAIDPFSEYAFANGPDGPIVKPEIWIEQLGKCALYLCAIRSWIADDYITLIQPPHVWNANIAQRYGQLIQNKAMERTGKWSRRIYHAHKVEFTIDILQDYEDDVREFALKMMKRDEPQLYEEVAPQLRAMEPQPGWFEVPLPIEDSSEERSQVGTTGGGLAPFEAQFLMTRWNLYLSSSRAPSVLYASMNGPGSGRANKHGDVADTPGFAIDQSLRRLPIEFPTGQLDVGLEVVYRLRKDGRLENLRRHLQDEYNEFSTLADGTAEERVDQLALHVEQALRDHNDEWEQLKHDALRGFIDFGLLAGGPTFAFAHSEMSLASWGLTLGGVAIASGRRKATKAHKLSKAPLYVLHRLS